MPGIIVCFMLSSCLNVCSTEFILKPNGHLVATKSNYCVKPINGNAVAGAQLQMATVGCHAFQFTSKGSIKHKASGLCIQTAGKVSHLEYPAGY